MDVQIVYSPAPGPIGFADITVELASTTLVSGGSTSVVTLTGAAEDDLVVVYRACDEADSYAAISGYTAHGASDTRLATDYKIMGVSPDASVTVPAMDTTLETAAIVLIIRGADTTTPFDISEARNAGAGANNTTPPAVTTVTDKAMVVALVSLDDDTSSVTAYPSGYINTTEQAAGPDDGATGVTIGLATKIVTTAGLETPGTYTMADGDFIIGITQAIRPAAA